MPSKTLNVPPSGARPSPKEPPLSIAGVNPVRVPPSAAAVAIAAVNNLPELHPRQFNPLRAPLRSALANHCPAHAPLVLTHRSRFARSALRAASLRPTRFEATSAARSAPLRACESSTAHAPLVLTHRSRFARSALRAASLRPSRSEATPLRPPLRYGLANHASAACLLASAPRAIERGHFVVSLSLRLATLASARCSCRSPFDGSRPVRARKFPRLCRLRVRCARSRVVVAIALARRPCPLSPPPRPPSPSLASLAARRGV